MAVYQCEICGFLYDEKHEEVKWEDLPDDWVCPVCAASKDNFKKVEK